MLDLTLTKAGKTCPTCGRQMSLRSSTNLPPNATDSEKRMMSGRKTLKWVCPHCGATSSAKGGLDA